MALAGAMVAGCASLSTSMACVVVSAAPDGPRLAAWPAADGDEIRMRYVHSVTRTPVEERYRIDGGALAQTEIRFSEHGPGLPTAADDAPGAAWSREHGQFVVRMARRFDSITARVDAAQAPRLVVGSQDVDLAQWGRRSLRLELGPCGDE